MIDEKTLADLKALEEIARRRGRNIWEMADEIGLLTTPERRRQLEFTAVHALLQQLPEEPTALLDHFWGLDRRGSHTPLTTYQAVISYIEKYLEALSRGEEKHGGEKESGDGPVQ